MDTTQYEWFPPQSVRRMLEPVRGRAVPASTLTYWRRMLGISPSTDELTYGLYSAQDVVDLAGGIIWKDSKRPLKVYKALLDKGYRLAESYIHELESLTLVNVQEVTQCPVQEPSQTVTVPAQTEPVHIQQQIWS